MIRSGRVLALAACLGALAPLPLRAQANPFTDSLLPRVRAMAEATAGERPRSVHVMKILESSGPLNRFVAVADTAPVASCFPVFQIRWRDRWIVVDAALDSLEIVRTYGARVLPFFHQARYDRLALALRDADRIVLTHEHVDHAVGVERGPYFETVAPKTLLTEEQMQSLLEPKAHGIVRLAADSAAAFPVLKYGLLYPLAPGVVLIKAPGHTPGSQFVYVRLSDNREVLLLGDLAWQHEGLAEDVQKPEATSRSLGENRDEIRPELEWARQLWQEGRVAPVLSHDGRLIDSLVSRGILRNDFDLRHR